MSCSRTISGSFIMNLLIEFQRVVSGTSFVLPHSREVRQLLMGKSIFASSIFYLNRFHLVSTL